MRFLDSGASPTSQSAFSICPVSQVPRSLATYARCSNAVSMG